MYTRENEIEMISKELLSEVLNLNITYIEHCNNSIIYKISVYDREEEVNIYELAHKCKEWAYSTYGIMIQSYPYCGKSRADALKGLEVDEVFKENTEVEAIIQACEWILEYKKNQCTK